MELKAAWRRLGSHDDPTHFYVSQVRYYGQKAGKPCFVDSGSRESKDRWGLVALHVMHKTASAPYFIWATFEQVNTLVLEKLGPDERPVPVETAEGSLTAAGQVAKASYSPGLKTIPATPNRAQEFLKELLSPPAVPGLRLYFHKEAKDDTPEVKSVAVNSRIRVQPPRRLLE